MGSGLHIGAADVRARRGRRRHCRIGGRPDGTRFSATGYACGIVVLAYHTNAWSYALFSLDRNLRSGSPYAVTVSLVPKLMHERRPTDALTRIACRTHERA
jgi:hypothetical protein